MVRRRVAAAQTPLYDSGIRAGIIHHSATGNDYGPGESAKIVIDLPLPRACDGCSDIAYNALVDRHGRVFEGRFGGLDRPVDWNPPRSRLLRIQPEPT